VSTSEISYVAVADLARIHSTATNALCVPQSIRNIETVFGKLSLSNLTLDTLNEDAQVFLNANITPIACTSCAKAAYNIGMNHFPGQVSQANPILEVACGASFLGTSVLRSVVNTRSVNLNDRS
jgi:hypothetical protein